SQVSRVRIPSSAWLCFLVVVRHLEDLVARVLADQVGMVGADVSLDVLDELVVGGAFDVLATRTVNDLHEGLQSRLPGAYAPVRRAVAIGSATGWHRLAVDVGPSSRPG